MLPSLAPARPRRPQASASSTRRSPARRTPRVWDHGRGSCCRYVASRRINPSFLHPISPCFFQGNRPSLTLTPRKTQTGRHNLHPQLPRLPRRPARRRQQPLRLLLVQAPRARSRRRADPRGRPQMHLLQRHPAHHQLSGRVPGQPTPTSPARARDQGVAHHHARKPAPAHKDGSRPLDVRLRPL